MPPAPLVYSLADARARRDMATLAAYVFSTHTKELWDTDNYAKLMRRLNAFAQLELNLWYFASNGGHTAPPPYTVRYDLARWLWHPSIAGAIFCLRCGNELWYTRSERTCRDQHRGADGQRRTARCRKCSRGRADDWPKQAIEPYQQGTWLLRCTFPGCANLFVGRRQARHCEHHRLNRLNPQLRPTHDLPA